ncbi:GPR1/FUN34/yaaH family-domain-containing protein [Xylaria nigripes]|nr:GPR1/FUN34/yaaH family-domain-containing protein [Xylaria nigripes]
MSEIDSKVQPDPRVEMLDVNAPGGRVSITPEILEQLYLSQKLRVPIEMPVPHRFAKTTAIALGGFLACSTPLSMILLGWQGAGGFGGAANVGTYFVYGGLLELIAGIGEWVHGNTFACTVFFIFGGFWLSLATTIIPAFNAWGIYSTTDNPVDGIAAPQFNATLAFWLLSMTLLCVVFTIASLRTNVVLFVLLLLLIPCFASITGAYFSISHGLAERAQQLQFVAAGLLLAVSFLGWYLFLVEVLDAVDFPIALPVGDLSKVIPARKRDQNKGR